MSHSAITLMQVRKAFEAEIYALICRKVNHQDFCNDIMQEVYLKIWTNIDRIGKADNLSAYVVRMTTNVIADYYRKQARIPLIGEFTDALEIGITHSAEENGLFHLADCCLRPFIDSLPTKYQDIIVQVELQGMKLKDYAQMVGITLTNAKTRVQRARQKLKDAILQCCNYQFDGYGNAVSCCSNDLS
ncbi:sigma-70 family RNA polymerase sigma factor [Paraflavitalea pollutisoli]|uniref:sigma-70 family RNA polymerase sigma factor n=1 Tax=Paraflavitalea pollutisoli TaxID=3034143 RepID=UPI0023EC4737|nr:sigma-70 family RNA polymerase sigma factor [Paraflavitalea sp. H1-2-19X]